jgi:hypothetical protein
MSRVDPSDSVWARLWVLPILLTAFLAACTSSVSPPKGPELDYQQAKMMFKQGNWDRALSLTDTMASPSSNDPNALYARVLRAIIYSGRVKAYKELADTYKKGSQAAKNPRFITSYNRRYSNSLQYGSGSALNLGEVIVECTSTPDFPKEPVLDAPWPSTEGPEVISALVRIRRGEWVPEDEQDNAVLDAQRKGINDMLGELVGGGHSRARTEMNAGPVKLSGLDFAFFLEKQIVDALAIFGPRYLNSPGQLRTLCGVANRFASSIATMLKEHPDKAKEEELKKLQKQIKDAEQFT